MGQGQSAPGGAPGEGGDKKARPRLSLARAHRLARSQEEKKKKWEPPPPPTRVGKKQRRKAADAASRLPSVAPSSKCKLRLLKLERVRDYLLLEEEYVTNQERLKPAEARNQADRSKVDDLRGTPMSVGSLEEMIDDKCAGHARAQQPRETRHASPPPCAPALPLTPPARARRAQPRHREQQRGSGVLREHHVVRGQVAGACPVAAAPARLTRRSWSPAAPC